MNGLGAGFVLKNLYTSSPVFVPYIIYSAVIWKLAGNRSYSHLILIASIAPVFWGIFYTLSHMLLFYIKDRMIDGFLVLCIMTFWATVVGYLIEIIPLIILVAFRNDFKQADCEKSIEA
jgi:hypothetical protein